MRGLLPTLGQGPAGLDAASWEALGTWATFVVACLAGVFAWRQVREARSLREEQAQPYVVAFMEPSPAWNQAIDLVIRNFGKTAAHNVRVTPDVEMRRSSGMSSTNRPESEAVWLPERISVLAPGQEWRTLWDTGPSRSQSELPDRYELTVRCTDSRGRELQALTVTLDWGQYKGRWMLTVYGLHDMAKSQREIKDILKRWGEGSSGLRVYARDGKAKDDRERAWAEQLDQRRAETESATSEGDGTS